MPTDNKWMMLSGVSDLFSYLHATHDCHVLILEQKDFGQWKLANLKINPGTELILMIRGKVYIS